MTRPTAPPDPSSTFVDDDVDRPQTGEITAVTAGTETTASVLAPVPSTDATFVELSPTPSPQDTAVAASDAALPAVPPALAQQQTVVSRSDAALPPMQAPLPSKPMLAPSQTAALTTESDPDPRAFLRLWLVIPRFRTQRRVAAAGVALVLIAFGMLLGANGAKHDPGAARPFARTGPRVEAAEPKQPVVLDAPKALQAAAPIWVERAVDAGEGTTRVERVEGGMIKIHSEPITEVVMDGVRLGPVPVFITAPIGRISFVLESKDAGIYKPISLPLYGGKNQGRLFDLGRGWLEVVAPRGSQVTVNGRLVGAAPIPQLELYEGFHRVDVLRPDKTRVSKSIEVLPRFTTTHEISN